jgi:pyruvate,water dikinase
MGKSAAGGVARGRPVVVRSENDLNAVAAGDVLVAAQTDVAYLAAMHRASAIVTETGGRFCHAAVWARENKKPTVLQAARATDILESVDEVIVDGDQGVVEWRS